jgi:hypothetical protein
MSSYSVDPKVAFMYSYLYFPLDTQNSRWSRLGA